MLFKRDPVPSDAMATLNLSCDLGELKKESFKFGLKKFFEGKHCSCSDFDRLCEMASVHPPKELYDAIHLAHCVNWGDMEPALREMLFNGVVGLFAQPDPFTFDTSIIDGIF